MTTGRSAAAARDARLGSPQIAASDFAACTRGSFAVWLGLMLPVLGMCAGMSIDYARFTSQKSQLAAATDAAALASAKQMSLTDLTRYDLSAVAKAVVSGQMTAQAGASNLPPISVDTRVETGQLEVTVNAAFPFAPSFGLVSSFLPSEVKARSVARIVGKPNICVLALEPIEIGAMFLAKSARMTGNNCSVFSNSLSANGIIVRDNAQLTAKSVCSSGGVQGGGSIMPQAISDCPQFVDPLVARPAPTYSGCDYNNVVIKDKTTTLKPGVYCGGLRIDGSSTVTLETGDYIIEGGEFRVNGSSSVSGEAVSIYLGDKAFMYFGPNTSIDLTAMRTGAMAGLLFFGSRNQSEFITHSILSRQAQKLVGTIYFPRSSFIVDGEAGVGGDSAYTAIVARRVVLLAGPHLVLNSNYDQTDVPVPEGIRGATEPARLVQ